MSGRTDASASHVHTTGPVRKPGLSGPGGVVGGLGGGSRGGSGLNQPSAAGQPQDGSSAGNGSSHGQADKAGLSDRSIPQSGAAADGGDFDGVNRAGMFGGGAFAGSWGRLTGALESGNMQDLIALFSCRPCCEAEINAGGHSDSHAAFDALQANIPDEHDFHQIGGAFVVSAADAQAHAPSFQRVATEKAPKMNPLLELKELPEIEVRPGQRYKGQWRGQVFHGMGVYTRNDGSLYRYEGMFEDGQEHGSGRCVIDDLEVYEGQMNRGKAHGEGRYMHEDGSTYQGEWVEGNKEGTGIERWSDGSRYEGQFVNDLKDGVGMYYISTGDMRFKGQFRKDKMDGTGVYYFQGGGSYDGQWQHGRRHGLGVIRAPGDVTIQHGRWSNGTMLELHDAGDGAMGGSPSARRFPGGGAGATGGSASRATAAPRDTDPPAPWGGRGRAAGPAAAPAGAGAGAGVGIGLRGMAGSCAEGASPAMAAAGGEGSGCFPLAGLAAAGTGDAAGAAEIDLPGCGLASPPPGEEGEQQPRGPASTGGAAGGTAPVAASDAADGSPGRSAVTSTEGAAVVKTPSEHGEAVVRTPPVHPRSSTGDDSGTVTVDVDEALASQNLSAHPSPRAAPSAPAEGDGGLAEEDSEPLRGSMAVVRRIMEEAAAQPTEREVVWNAFVSGPQEEGEGWKGSVSPEEVISLREHTDAAAVKEEAAASAVVAHTAEDTSTPTFAPVSAPAAADDATPSPAPAAAEAASDCETV